MREALVQGVGGACVVLAIQAGGVRLPAQPEDVQGPQHSSFLMVTLSDRNPPSPRY